jgi:hypothetical protein
MTKCSKTLTDARAKVRMGQFFPADDAARDALRCSTAKPDCATRTACGEEARAILAHHLRARQSQQS